MGEKEHIWVVGMNEMMRDKLEALRQADECEFHQLLTYEDSHGASAYYPEELMERAIDTVESADEPVDAVMSSWDFPVMFMTPLLAEHFGTRWHALESIMKCEHKYWSRCNQKEAIPEFVPKFARFDPFDDNAREKIDMDYPFWIKPMISFAGHLGLKIESEEDFQRGIDQMRQGIDRFSTPFEYFLQFLPEDTDFPGMEEGFAIAEDAIGGTHCNQCTVEGYAADGEVHCHGVVDSYRFPNLPSFSRYEYPSTLPEEVRRRMEDASRRIMKHVGFDVGGWNIEYFHDPETDEIRLLEINGRVSVSHADLFHKVDGQSNLDVVVSAARGKQPDWREREGRYNVAGKFFLRHFSDGKVVRTPTATQVQNVKEVVPRTLVDVLVEPNSWLHDLEYQDSYSYKLAAIYLGGRDAHEMLQKFQEIIGEMDFTVLTPEEVENQQYEPELKEGVQEQA